MSKVDCRSVKVIGEIRTAWAASLPTRTEHEVIDDELAAAIEEIAELLLAARAFKDILLVNCLTRKFPALA